MIFLSGFDEMTPEEVYADPRLATVDAVENKRIYKTPLGGYRWQVPSAESPLMWAWMHHVLYPGEGAAEFREDVHAGFEDLFAYDISDEEIDKVLRTAQNKDSADYDQFAH